MIDADNWFQTNWSIRLPNGALVKTMTGQTWVWQDREDAEKALVCFKAYADQLGVDAWAAEVVRQLATPWIGENDTAELLVHELSQWLDRETGTA